MHVETATIGKYTKGSIVGRQEGIHAVIAQSRGLLGWVVIAGEGAICKGVSIKAVVRTEKKVAIALHERANEEVVTSHRQTVERIGFSIQSEESLVATYKEAAAHVFYTHPALVDNETGHLILSLEVSLLVVDK